MEESGAEWTKARAMQTALLLVSFVALIWAWSFPFNTFADTPWIDITLAEPTLFVGALVLLAARAWRLIDAGDRSWLIVLAAYLGWLLVAAVARMSGLDVKRAVAYAVYTVLSVGVAFAAVRLGPLRAARWIVAFVAAAVVIAFAGAVLERVTYTPAPAQDPLAAFWALFRPQRTLSLPNVGVLEHAPLHYQLGGGGLIRVAGVSAHPLYLAFFSMLASGLMSALVVRAWRIGARVPALLFLAVLCLAVLVCYWTYSRAPLAGLVAVVVAMPVVDLGWRFARSRRFPTRSELVPGAVVVSALVVVLGANIAVDNVGVRRFEGTLGPSAPAAEGPADPVEASAARAASVRFRLQRLAVQMATDSPRSLVIGPGMTAYEDALKEQPRAVRQYTHPHSAWLTELLAGGVPAALLFAAVLAFASLGALRALPAVHDHRHAAILLWVAVWIPIWAAVQVFGLNPLVGAESVIVGSMLGFARGFSIRQPAEVRAVAESREGPRARGPLEARPGVRQ